MKRYKTRAAIALTFLLLLTVFSCWAKDAYKSILANSMFSDKKVVFTGKHTDTGRKAIQDIKKIAQFRKNP